MKLTKLLVHQVCLLILCVVLQVSGNFRRYRNKPVNFNFGDVGGDDDEEPRIFNYNQYLQRPYGTKVDSKSKVETLGKVLKGHIHDLKQTANKQIDIIFLVDASTSVGKNNFREEIKFVKKLLSDFTVDDKHTRVAVITFSSRDRVLLHVDYFDEKNKDRHKCALLEEDLKRIDYTGGGTFTLGAFLEAKKVLENARPDSSKAVFLITDGFSNGGDPRNEARSLKKAGVKIFTFGIQNGNVRELYDMASYPKNESCYILDSFEEFEALARRALHEDLTSGQYISQPLRKCNRLCVGRGCCDGIASCHCGTHTGKYECLCPPGFFGNGLRGGCQACPSGTYKSNLKPGDSYTCSKCPDENHITEPGAIEEQQCVCRKGYRNFNDTGCVVLKCPKLEMPKNGYFVNDKCKDVFNAACGLRCKPGYELRGSSLRICREDGAWSGTDTECIMKTCPALMKPKNGNMICTTDDFTFNTVCRFTCDTGYKLVGSRKRTCLAIAFWTGINTRCREITCRPLPEVRDGSIHPPSCIAGDVAFGTTCTVTCHSGYTLIGPHSKQCLPEGIWTPASEPIQCDDTSAPFIMCPYNIEAVTDLNENSATVSWQVPLAVDNSGYVPVLSSVPAVIPPARFPIGTTKVTYVAEDLNKNNVECHFYINVKDKQKPTMDRCFSPLPIVSPEPYADITWEEPLFSDNSGEEVRIQRSHAPGLFPKGKTEVVYTAYDESGNNNTCSLKINIIGHPCEYPPIPMNGNRTCVEDSEGVTCSFSCHEGFHFAIVPAQQYFCAFDNVWEPADQMPISDCSALSLSNEIIQPASFTFAGLIACQERAELVRLEKDFEHRVTKRINELCEEGVNCELRDLETTCQPSEDLNTRIILGRNKRSSDDTSMAMRYKRQANVGNAQVDEKAIITFNYTLAGKIEKKKKKKAKAEPINVEKLQEKLFSAMSNIATTLKKDAKKGDFDLQVKGNPLELSAMSFEENPLFVCEEGSVNSANSCVKCPAGTFFNIVSKECESCKKGTFQTQPGQLSCMFCPSNTSTPGLHATSENNCKALCLPGSFSYNGLEMCETCRRAYFQNEYGQTTCERCPKRHSTLRRGTMGKESCKEKCRPGYVSKTGLSPCWACPKGSYQPRSGKDVCFECPGKSTTPTTASTGVSDCEMELSDDPFDQGGLGGGGQQEKLIADECMRDPCLNGATCSSELFGFDCVCADGYTGVFCQDEVNDCGVNPCLNGGTCRDLVAGFLCMCEDGFTGKKCESNIDECLEMPCLNGATCVDGINSYTCLCELGFEGDKCETDLDDCEAVNCLNNGACVDEVGGYQCVCPAGVSGQNCEINDDNCASGPCQNDAECVDEIGGFTCNCQNGFTGPQCEIDIDECADFPCGELAKCEDLPGRYVCHCPTGLTGPICDTVIDSYFQLDFPATTTLMDYARTEMTVDLTDTTVCFWMKTTDQSNQGTPFSYATTEGSNIFTLSDYDGFVFNVNGEKITTTVKANDGIWHHVCIMWSSGKGEWKLYLDGIAADSGRNLARGQTIKGGGVFVVGQEQDSMGGDFTSSESFIGHLTQLNMWDSALSLREIETLRINCENRLGNVIAWTDIAGTVRGSVSEKPVEFCKACPEPDVNDNGVVEKDGLTAGSYARYVCQRGFTVNGKYERQCLVTGEWDGEAPTCQKISCGFPGLIQNGWIEGQRYTFDNRIRYKCNRGYQLVGDETRSCTEFGIWDGTEPVCELIKCKLPAMSENTFVTNPQPENKYTPGSEVYFDCAPGNQLYSEHNSVYCQRDGTWDNNIPTCDPQKCLPPLPEILNGTPINDSLLEFPVGHIVNYLCDFGYVLSDRGPNPLGQLTCLPSGQWESDLPTCEVVTCPEPDNIAHGSYELPDGNLQYLSQLLYRCDTGYEISDDTIIECYEDGLWSAQPPQCIAVRCATPTDVLHGSYEGDGVYEYRSVVTYTCNLGYNLVGENLITCMADASYSGPTPVCKAVSCGRPDDIEHGQYIGRDFTLNNVIRYECNDGYVLSGTVERVCRETGNWQGNAPTCARIQCVSPPNVANGFFFDATFHYEDTVTYQCDDGYRLSGDAILTCLSTGRWSPLPPTCDAIVCGSPQSVENAAIINTDASDSYSIGYQLQYKCNIGYEFSLNSFNPTGEIECENTGQWQTILPECVLVRCVQPVDILNGQYRNDGLVYGSSLTYTCNEGYELIGDSLMTCGADSRWSGIVPNCDAMSCASPDIIQNGRIDYKDLKFGSVIRYMCQEGYELIGEEVRRCLSNLSFSDAEPICQAVQCGEPSDLLHGTADVEGYDFQSIVTYQCDVGYILQGDRLRTCTKDKVWTGQTPVCDIVQCDKPTAIISNGRMLGTNFTYGSVIEYLCDEGYLLDGLSAQRTCLAIGQWDNPIPVCIAVECPRLSVRNGFTSTFKTQYGTTVELSCRKGYRLQGATERTCQQSGQWSGEATVCVKYLCPRLEPPTNGQVIVRGGKATYHCLEGYTLVGEASRTCQADNSWSAADPVCEANACEDITSQGFPDGRMEYEDLVFRSYITFTCNTGYILEGDRLLECYADGSWSAAVPFCRKIECPHPYTPQRSRVIGTDFSFNSSIRYACDEGYRLIDDVKRTCQADGSWSGRGPSCIYIICPPPSPNTNVIYTGSQYTYGAEIQYMCNSGYALQGPSTRTCTESGQWSGKEPECIRTDCQVPPQLANGRTYPTGLTPGSVVIYECNEGFELVGDTTMTCLSTAQWGGTNPYCVKVNCGPPPQLQNGYVHGNNTFYEDVIEYRCDQGFTLAGANRRVCLSNGQWGGADPTCTRVSCGPVKVPTGVNFKLPEGADEGSFETRTELTCDEGFNGIGTNYQVCQANGRWSDLNFYCEKITCEDFSNIRNGLIIGSSFDYGSKLVFQCDEGYRLVGDGTITCRANGKWDYEVKPHCEEVTCPKPSPLNNGDLSATGSGINMVLTFRCDEGYRLHGSNRRACQRDGSWSGADAYCRLVICTTPPTVENARPFDSVSQYLYNFEARYNCDKGFEVSSGDSILTCSKSGEWSGVAPTCSRISCGEPTAIKYGHVDVASYEYEGAAEYVCDDGYRLKGTPTIVCAETGKWTGSVPSCVPINCGPPPDVLNSLLIDTKQHTFNSIVTYICEEGYSIIGPQSSTCLATGIWSGPKPFCAPISCGKPPAIDNAIHTEGKYEYKTRVTYSCLDGFELTGNPTLECINNGAWSGERPVCHKIDCGPPPVLPHSSTILPNGPGIGKEALLECNDGYYIVGSGKAVCTERKVWDFEGESPTCRPVDCYAPSEIPNTIVIYEGTTFGSVGKYVCNEGYYAVGPASIVCSATGQWSGDESPCQPIECGPPPSGPNMVLIGSSSIYTLGNTVQYECDKDYTAVGSTVLTCTESGQWSGDQPTCIRISCGPFKIPKHGRILTGDVGIAAYSGDRVTMGCDKGFDMVGTGQLECMDTGLWSSDPPICIEKRLCKNDTGVRHARPVDTSLHGRSVILGCKEGYTPVGNMSITCNDDGTWTSPGGQCTRVFCGKPQLRDFVNVVRIRGNSYFYNDQISFRCRAGVAPSRSPPIVTCQQDGHWDGDIACGVTCKQPCQNGGICLGLNRCKCQNGYVGRLCEKAICILPCLNGGRCIAPYQCSCPNGYTGVRCNQAVCDKQCGNGGRCIRPNKCKCAHGYGGRFCGKKLR